MSVQDYYEPFSIYDEIISPNAFGSDTQYIKTETIQGAIGTLSREQRMVAEANGISAKYIFTFNDDKTLKYGKILYNENNSQYYRIVSDDRDYVPPKISTFDWKQVYLDSFYMPKEE